jgi:hypothetical protein
MIYSDASRLLESTRSMKSASSIPAVTSRLLNEEVGEEEEG